MPIFPDRHDLRSPTAPDIAAALKKRTLRLIPSTGAASRKIVNQASDQAKPDVVARALLIREKK